PPALSMPAVAATQPLTPPGVNGLVHDPDPRLPCQAGPCTSCTIHTLFICTVVGPESVGGTTMTTVDIRPGPALTEPAGLRTEVVWTVQAVQGLGVTTDVETAAAILGIGRTKAYELAKNGEFPIKI